LLPAVGEADDRRRGERRTLPWAHRGTATTPARSWKSTTVAASRYQPNPITSVSRAAKP